MSETRKDNNQRQGNNAPKKNGRYVLNVEQNKGYNPEYQSNRPSKNGEVYFANYQKEQKPSQRGVSPRSAAGTVPKSGDESDTRMFTAPRNSNSERRSMNGAAPRQQRPAQRSANPGTNGGETPRDRYRAATSPKNANSKMTSQRNRVNDNRPIGENFRREKPPVNDAKQARKMKRAMRRREPNYMKRVLFSVISIVLVTSLLSAIGIGCINDVLAINGNSDEVTVTIPKESSVNDIIRVLKKNGLIHNKLFCEIFAAFRGYGGYDDYIGGVYDLKTDMGLEGMLNEMRESNSYDEDDVVTLSFPEGWTVQQIMNRLVENEVITKEKFVRGLTFSFDYKFINKSSDACVALEGVMFPDTYEFFVGESASGIIRKFLDNFNNKWTAEYQQRADELGLSVTEVVTIASIIQKEAANSEQMPGVSAVIHNRLKNSTNYPLLQCDSTANYVSEYLRELVGDTEAQKYKSAYDTGYARSGLPAGPICNPGKDAIVAALYPDTESENLYFAHDVNGKIYYATNDLDFSRNLSEIQEVNEKANSNSTY